jgi:hypothetical protein
MKVAEGFFYLLFKGFLWTGGKIKKAATAAGTMASAASTMPAPVPSFAEAAKYNPPSLHTTVQGVNVERPKQAASTEPAPSKTQVVDVPQPVLKDRPAMSVSSRVLTIPLEADGGLPIGTAWLYLYEKEGIARRVVKFHNPTLAKLICGPDECRYFFSDVKFEPQKGTKQLSEAFVIEIRQLLDRKKATVRVEKQGAARKPAPQVAAPPVTPPPTVQPAPVKAKEVEQPSRRINKPVKGQTYEGQVVSAGMTVKQGREGEYQTFCLTIHDGEREVPVNGTEIQRQVKDMGIRVGEKVRVVAMGSEAVNGPGREGEGWKRNLYQLTRLEARTQ